MILLPSANWLRKMACMSSFVLDLTYVLNGKWEDFLGGCLRRKISDSVKMILISSIELDCLRRKLANSSLHSLFRTADQSLWFRLKMNMVLMVKTSHTYLRNVIS